MKTILLLLLMVLPTGLNAQINDATPIRISPNPTSDQVTIEGLNESFQKVLMYDSHGKSVLRDVKVILDVGSKVILDVSALNTGVYYIKANSMIHKIFKE